MKGRRWLCAVLAAMMLSVTACGGGSRSASGTEASPDAEEASGEGREEAFSLFPMTQDGFVGDTMPYFEDGVMNIYYLLDQRDGKTGYHPWALLRTEDYCTYENAGIVLPYGDSAFEQDNALGTGCVMKDQEGRYHAFFTGHNDYYAPAEAIMHAEGTDLTTWTKIKEDTFTDENYSTNDFRDPYVFYVPEENCYWMLVVTRKDGNGVIARYTSTDLHKWKDEGVFFEDDMGFGTNMECPSLLQFGGKWYLAFSDQWPDRVVHYRIGDSIHGPFVKPEKDTVDGNGFYAGRLETDGEHLYLVGWNGTKFGHDDLNDYDWAGAAVIHELKQTADGRLVPVVNSHITETLDKSVALTALVAADTLKLDGESVQFTGARYERIKYDAFENATRLEADITGLDRGELFGISFAPNAEYAGALTYLFNVAENRVEFYNTPKIFDSDAQSFMDFDFSGRDKIHMTMLISDGVVSLYLDDEIALTARMYRSQGTAWQFFGIESDVRIDNIAAYE